MRSVQDDLQLGVDSEVNCREYLGRYLATNLIHNRHYDTFDYANDNKNIYVELKTRRVNRDTYATALIGANKVACAAAAVSVNPNHKYYFAYKYENGLYIIQYNPELFASFRLERNYRRSLRTGTTNTPSDVVHIPTNLMTRVQMQNI